MVRWPAGRSGVSPNFPVPNGSASERLTSPLTVRSDLHKRWSAQRWAATYSHGGSQGFKSPHLHPQPAGQSVASLERAALTACCGRATAASVSRSPARRLAATRRLGPGPSTVTTERGRRLQPELRVRCDARQSGREATLAQADGRAVRGHGRTARPGPSWPCGCRRTDALHEVTGADTADADAERADTDPGHRTSTPDSGQRTRGHHMRGHWTFTRTPDTGRVDATEYSDRATSTRQAPDRHPGPPRPPDRPLGRRTVDLWTAPAALGNDDGSATMRYLPARDYLQHYQAPAQSLCRPSRALAHCSPQTISGRA